MGAIGRSKVKIYVAAKDTNPAALNTTTAIISGQIKSYSKSGGEQDIESDPVFGGYVDKEKPTSQVEVSFEVVPDLTTAAGADLIDSLIYGSQSGVYTMSSNAADKAIFIVAQDSTLYKTYAFNNCNAVSYDIDHNADDNRSGTLTFKFSPTTATGISNFMTAASNVTTLAAWSVLTSA
jgi:hypothetical protein